MTENPDPVDRGVALGHLGVGTNRPVGRNNRVRTSTTKETITACAGLDPDRRIGFQEADKDRGGDRAAEIAHAADHDDDEGFQHPVEAHGVVDADQGTEQHAARRRHAGADGEHEGVHPGNRNAHGLRHDAILRGGADPDAVGAVFEEQPEAADDGGREAGDDQPVPRVVEIEQAEVAGERLLDLARHRTELPQRVVLQHQRDAERRQDGGQVDRGR